MAQPQDSWTEVGKVFEGLALKIKLHFEEAQGAAEDVGRGLDAARMGVERAFEALGDAVRDPAIKDDVRSAAAALSDAVSNTLAVARTKGGAISKT
jgi:hypothetical protein